MNADALPAGTGDELLYLVAEQSAWLRRLLAVARKPELDAVIGPALDRLDAAVARRQVDGPTIKQVAADLAYAGALLSGRVIE